jgi:hypothetical protein
MKIHSELKSIGRVVIKAAILFVAFNVVFAALIPLPALSRLSIHNTLLPGRLRMPFAGGNDIGYGNASMNIDLMLSVHEITGTPKADNEYRVLLIGDSAAWGFLHDQHQTLSESINDLQLIAQDGRQVRMFNLAYPGINVMSDLLVMARVNQFRPDLVVWMVTLETFRTIAQNESLLVCTNLAELRPIMARYDIEDIACPYEAPTGIYRETIVGQRRELARMLRLQLDGMMWAATGIDHKIAKERLLRRVINGDKDYMGLQGPTLHEDDVLLNAINAAKGIVDADLMIVNEPIVILNSINSSTRYNYMYPRWAYDQGTAMIEARARALGVPFVNLWDAVPPHQFTDHELHYTPAATRNLARILGEHILNLGPSVAASDEPPQAE